MGGGVTSGPILGKGLLTIGTCGTDNIDINSSNRDPRDALHGTGCALAQLSTSNDTGNKRSTKKYRESARGPSNLPSSYTNNKGTDSKYYKVDCSMRDWFM